MWTHVFSNGCISADGDRVTRVLSLTAAVVVLRNNGVLLSKYASEQVCSQGRALLEALELTGAQIAQCYGMHPLNEVELVQEDCRCELTEA